MWYKDGSVQVALNSNIVTGTGTFFGANVRVGDAFKGPDGAWYEVTNVVSNTVLSIDPPYLGANATGQTYSITPVQGYIKRAADRLAVITDGFDSIEGDVADAAASAASALASKDAAAGSATAAAGSATAASGSAAAAAGSATSATASKNAAATSETNALNSKNAAATSATNAATSETNALASKNAAATSATAAAGSATAANTSKINAGTSETTAAASATAAAGSATAAATSATAANTSKVAAATSETNALASKNAAATSETNAAGSATAANTSKLAAAASATAAAESATDAAAGALAGLDKQSDNLIANPTFLDTGSRYTFDGPNGNISYANYNGAGVPAGCPAARVGVILKKVASTLTAFALPLINGETRVPCVPGEKFDLSVWVNVVGGGATGTDKARMTCIEYDATAGGAATSNTRVLSYDQAVGGWQKLVGTFTAGASTRSFTFGPWNETTMPVNGTIYFAEPEVTRRNSIMGLLGSMGFGDFASPLIFDLQANVTAGPFQCLAAAAQSAGLPDNVGHTGIQLRQSATSNLQIVAPISSSAAVNRKLLWRNSYNSIWSTWSEVGQANGGTFTSIALAGICTAPLAATGTNTSQVSSTAFVQQELSVMRGAAPAQLDTLAKLAAAVNNDGAFSTNIIIAVNAREIAIAAGTAGQFWNGTKTWSDFATSVRASALTGLSLVTGTAVTAADALLTAIGKLQKQITDLGTSKQNALGYTPVQQGTGVGQVTNAVKIGWTTGAEIKITVDSTDMGAIAMKSFLGTSATLDSAVTVVNSSIVQRDSAGSVYANAAYVRSIELGLMNGTAGSAFVDFHTGATVVDYDARILSDSPNGSTAGGALRYFANGGHIFTGSGSFSGTLDGAGGTYDMGSRVWSAASFNPNTKLGGSADGLPGQLGGYNRVYAPYYQNFTVPQQVYNGAIEVREAGLMGNGGAAPGHIYNAPGITFHWSAYAVAKLMMNTAGNLCWGQPNGAYSQFTTAGDLSGSIWGGTLSSWLNTICLTDSNWRTKLANLRAGELGSYVMAAYSPAAAVALNAGTAGSNLIACSSQGSNQGATFAGNWYCCGFIASSLQNTLWQRYI